MLVSLVRPIELTINDTKVTLEQDSVVFVDVKSELAFKDGISFDIFQDEYTVIQ